jgi:hypothetical protein
VKKNSAVVNCLRSFLLPAREKVADVNSRNIPTFLRSFRCLLIGDSIATHVNVSGLFIEYAK